MAKMIAPWETAEQAAREYVSLLLDTAPNGWGQHVHPIHGASHSMLHRIHQQFGEAESERAFYAEIERRKAQKGGK